MKKYKKIIYSVFSFILLSPMFVLAADYGLGTNPGVGGSTTSAADLINKIIKFILGFVGALSVLMIVAAGIMYIISAGDSDKVDTAKKWLIYAIVGLVVALLGWVIVNAVITGLNS